MWSNESLTAPSLVESGVLHVSARPNRTVHAGINPQLLYRRQWRRFALRRRLALILLVGWLPAVVGVLVGTFWVRYWPVWGVLAGVGWGGGALAVSRWASAFRCPRCSRIYREPGFKRALLSLTRGHLERNCAGCNLPKFDRRGRKGSGVMKVPFGGGTRVGISRVSRS